MTMPTPPWPPRWVNYGGHRVSLPSITSYRLLDNTPTPTIEMVSGAQTIHIGGTDAQVTLWLAQLDKYSGL